MLMKRLAVRCALILVVTIPVFAQESSTWIEKKVVAKYHYPLKVGDQPVEREPRFHVYTVKRVEGDRLWVGSGSLAGWIPSSQVVLLDQAINFYTKEIAADSAKPAAWRERGIIWVEKKEYDKAIADLQRGNPARSHVCRRLPQPGASLG